jgi:hypothetical protein
MAMSWLKALVSVPDGDRSWWSIVSWWEKRRLIFNAIVCPVGAHRAGGGKHCLHRRVGCGDRGS